MSRVEKTVFVSYRRTNEAWAVAVFGDITHIGYDVFIDYDGIASGNFEAAILENIKARAHFLVLLIPTALKRDPNDWMRREIEAALDSDRNIVPLMFPGFDFGTSATASQLTGKLAEFKQYNRMPIPASFFFRSDGASPQVSECASSIRYCTPHPTPLNRLRKNRKMGRRGCWGITFHSRRERTAERCKGVSSSS